ncbi:glycosyltransferase family 4 protein [Blastococcus sp. TML/C7B]|uniref:glycosyltransferase n=1 Tax=Blastococcus sp. TML/C7B TaxID=2798728 RepID=UPI00190A884A|nr:glycosyltransferase [Blastococcus sp. TML/C7B]MBN1095192.1 glycosyltransferase family 4 protein [Blastococcus sp. TML/C7B]
MLTAKNIFTEGAGDSALSRLLVEQLCRRARVSLVSLDSAVTEVTRRHHGSITQTLVPKPSASVLAVASRAVRYRQSLIHARFRSRRLRAVLADLKPDLIVAEHAYMAEEPLSLGGSWTVAVNNHVSESVALARRGLATVLLRMRLQEDEIRVNRRADRSLTFDREQAAALRDGGVSEVSVLDLVLPPMKQPQALGDHVLFVGDQRWFPNRQAVENLFGLVRRMQARGVRVPVDVVGALPSTPYRDVPSGVVIHGYVDDIDALYRQARCVVAPVATGGGVRVKILDAVARGVPVVTSFAGGGDIPEYLPIHPVDNDDEFIASVISLVEDRTFAQKQGHQVWAAGRARWNNADVANLVLGVDR